MQLKTSSLRVWFFRALIIIAVVLMIVSFSMPWWTVNITEFGGRDTVKIYGYGLSHSLIEHRDYVIADETPLYQTVFAWIYIVISAGLILYSLKLKGRLGRWLPAGIGAIYIAYALVAMFMVIANRLEDLGYPLQGGYVIKMPANAIHLYTDIRFGFYLALSAGVMCVIFALVRNVIQGKPSLVSGNEDAVKDKE